MITNKKKIAKIRKDFKLLLFKNDLTIYSFCREFNENYTNVYHMMNRSIRIDETEVERLKKWLK